MTSPSPAPESGSAPVGTPADVVISRAVQAHTRTLLAMCAVALVLGLIGAGALSMAGQQGRDLPMIAGLTLLGAGQLLAITGAVVAGLGLATILRGVGEPGSPDSRGAARSHLPTRTVEHTARRLAILLRVVVAAAVVGVAAWAIAAPAGLLGAAVGAVLTLQVAVVLAIVRVRVLLAPMSRA
ncbi:hypothetical protein EXU48_16255 [Occultella glacieicola]|uniref:Uncharacterized protein n=1 Tax=Occultella glacieicola TaxID=2518684 RepID=A0ABY2E4J9_9MICO|nr:hypothetical protein [Occultella glacieicola]TDE91683.1 hypothetical protein EXU48_16255 [Occultella glacieicola]